MENENVEVLRQLFAAFNGGDIELTLSLTDRAFEAEVPPSLSAEPDTYRGHDGMRRYWESFQEAMEEIHFEPERFWVAGETVVVAVRITAKGRRTAIAVEQRTAGVWTFRKGKALRARVYASTSEALEAAGLSE